VEFFSNFISVRKIIELYCQTFKNDMKMKKQLLVGSALLLAISVNSQNSRQFRPVTGVVNMDAQTKAHKLALGSAPEVPVTNANKFTNPSTEVGSDNSTASVSSPIISATFTRFSGSMNVFGMLVSNQKPLQYNRFLKVFSFIQRKSPTYVTNPALTTNAQSGAIVAMLGKNDGASWDSTLVNADNSNWSRYPQGGIYNPPGNTTYTNAFVVVSGPCTSAANSWVGSYFSSKKITSPGTNSTGVVGSEQQFIPNTSPFNNATSPQMKKQDFPRYSFASTDDGMVRSLAEICNDINGTTNTAFGIRGAAMNKGVFSSGVFVWSYDSFIPPVVVRTVNEPGTKSMWGTPYMAWNDAGTVGYVMFLGQRQGSTNQNVGWQPIIYKTTNSGNSWVVVNGIDFNTGNTYDKLLNSMNGPATNTTISIPFFKADQGVDLIVDNANKLHIISTAVGCAKQHPDSVEYNWQYTTENYSWLFQNTAYPYLCDFSGDGTGTWGMAVIDSLGTEGPSDQSGQPGFNSNPWSNQSQTNPVTSDDRIQISRSYDGQFIVYSWAESDTTLTTGTKKWNEFPNIHQRALRLCDGSVSTDELIISSPSSGFNARVRDKAYFHFMGSTCKAGGSTNTTATFTVPYTVSNNVATDGGVAVDNFFSNAIVTHNFPTSACGATVTTGIAAVKTEASESFVYPNPTNNQFNVRLNLANNNDISVDVYNAIGQKVAETKVNGQVGENNVAMNINNPKPGVYFVKIKVGKTESTKKLVIQ
jgi:hypothetical protein